MGLLGSWVFLGLFGSLWVVVRWDLGLFGLALLGSWVFCLADFLGCSDDRDVATRTSWFCFSGIFLMFDLSQGSMFQFF